jgi:hypothetical protein
MVDFDAAVAVAAGDGSDFGCNRFALDRFYTVSLDSGAVISGSIA